MKKLLLAAALFALPFCAALAQNKIEVRNNGRIIHSVETDAAEINMRGDGWKDLGTFLTSGGVVVPPPVGASSVTRIIPGTNVTVSPPTGKGEVTINSIGGGTGGITKIVPGANITVVPSTARPGEVTIGGAAPGTPIPGPKGDKGDVGATGAGTPGSAGVAGPTGPAGGVGKIIAGPGVTLSPATGLGTVTITSTAQSGGTGGPTVFQKPTSGEQWRSIVQAAIDGCYVAKMDPTTDIKVSATILIVAKDCGQAQRGVDGSGHQIGWTGNDPNADVVRVISSASARGMVFKGLSIYGGGYQGNQSRDCFSVVVDGGGRPIYKFLLQDIYTDYCGRHGVSLFGDVYEGSLFNIHAENHGQDGVRIEHLPGLIISNVYIIGLNSSRNKGYALRLGPNTSSVNVTQFSFVNNYLGGILAPGGMRSIDDGNCENTGPICVDMPTSIYTSRIVGVEGATDNGVAGNTPGSGPMRYLYRYGSGGALNQRDNSIVCYGASCTGVQLKAP